MAQFSPALALPKRYGAFLRPTAIVGLICSVAFLVYAPSLRFEFVYDDRMQILNNPWLRSWHYLPRYFTQHVWAFLHRADVGGYWRPVFLVWLRFNYVLFGLHPMGWHFTNVLVHVAVTVLVYLLARKLSGDVVLAAGASLIFAVHPACIETVVWVSGVTDSLLAGFLLSSILLYLQAQEPAPRQRRLRALSVGVYCLALLCKETAIIGAPLFLCLSWLYPVGPHRPARERFRTALVAGMSYVEVMLAYVCLRALVVHSISMSPRNSLLAVALSWPSLLWFYVHQLVVPLGLSACYELKAIARFSITQVLLPLALLAAVALSLWKWIRQLPFCIGDDHTATRSLAIFAVFLMILPLLPAVYIRGFVPYDLAHTRYLYLPCIGYSVLLATGVSRIRFGRKLLLGRPVAQLCASAVIIVLLAIGTIAQQQYWSDGLTLFYRSVGVAPHNPIAVTGLGVELGSRGEHFQALPLLLEVANEYPDYSDANRNVGLAYLLTGDYRRAEQYFRRSLAVESDPQCFAYLAEAQQRLGELDDALQSIEGAIRIDAEGYGYHDALGMVLVDRGDRVGAIQAFRTELAIHPGNDHAQKHLRQLLQSVPPPH